MHKSLIAVVAVIIGFAADGQYAPAGEIPIGGLGRFDYLTVDSPAKRLYVSHGTEVVVIDIATNKVIGKIADTPGVHGIAIAPNGKGFITDGQENKVAVFDLKTLQILMKVDTGANPGPIGPRPTTTTATGPVLNHSGQSADGRRSVRPQRLEPGYGKKLRIRRRTDIFQQRKIPAAILLNYP